MNNHNDGLHRYNKTQINILTTLRGWWWQKPGLRISWRTIDWLDALPPLRFGPGQCGQCPVDMKFTIIWLTMNTFYHFTHYHRRYNHHRHHFLFYHLLSVMCLCWLLMNLGVSVSLRPAIINMLMILMKITTISWWLWSKLPVDRFRSDRFKRLRSRRIVPFLDFHITIVLFPAHWNDPDIELYLFGIFTLYLCLFPARYTDASWH